MECACNICAERERERGKEDTRDNVNRFADTLLGEQKIFFLSALLLRGPSGACAHVFCVCVNVWHTVYKSVRVVNC